MNVVNILVGILFPFKGFTERKLFQVTGTFNGRIVVRIGGATLLAKMPFPDYHCTKLFSYLFGRRFVTRITKQSPAIIASYFVDSSKHIKTIFGIPVPANWPLPISVH